jgi:GDP-L-fucose synthase|tara:strand:+ start:6242 stop:7231 length:990 start_codon:yes stop_codon:yes gene_type:complete
MIDKKVLESFDGKSALVTGGTGLIGRQVVDLLTAAGCQLKIVSLDKKQNDNRHVYADLSHFDTCQSLTKRMDFVFHVAGVKGSIEVTKTKPASFLVPLLMMNTNVLEAARINKVEKLVYVSSVGAYASAEVFKEDENEDGPPMDSFPGMAKRIAEQQIKAYKIQYGMDNFSIVRPANVFGPGDNFDPENAMVIPSLMHRIHNANGSPVSIWGDGSAIRDFAYSKDVAEGIILALYHGTDSGFVNLGSGTGCSIKELVETLNSFIDFECYFDIEKPSGFPRRIMDISLAQKIIDYNPTTSLRDGLEETWNWFMSNTDEYLNKKNYFEETP